MSNAADYQNSLSVLQIKWKQGEAGDLTVLLENTGENGNAMMKLIHKLKDTDRSTIDRIYYKEDH